MESILIVVIIILSILLLLQDRAHVKEKNNLVNALIAKNTAEKVQLDMAAGITPQKEKELPSLVPMESLTDKEWENVILKNGNDK